MNELTSIQTIAAAALPLLLAITLHEAAHGWSAHRLGDNTAYMLGRVTINPLKHVDPLGTIVVPIAVYILSGFNFAFGWAKPVPVNFSALRNVRRDTALVAFAGPASNLLMLLGWALVIKLIVSVAGPEYYFSSFVGAMAGFGILINSILAALNLLPLLPLDGGRILNAWLPPNLSQAFEKMEPYGLFIILGLLFTGILSPVLFAMMRVINTTVFTLIGLN
ncbi:MAG: site-2 protease family protein [Pseudomonadota bacterium]